MERKIIYGAVVVGVIGTAVYLGWRSANLSPNLDQVDVSESASLLATPTLEITETPPTTPTETTPSATSINSRGDTFEVTPDPDGYGRQCVKLRRYIKGNKQDVDGAAIALGTNTEIYVDISGGDVYTAGGVKIGSFDRLALPDPDLFRIVPPGTTVCANISQ